MSKIGSLFGGGGGGGDDSGAQEAARRRQEEEARQRRIEEGIARINNSFAGFDDNFYAGRERAYNDYYLPQLKDQYDDSRESLIADLARSGQLKSTTANEAFADLDKQFGLRTGEIRNRAQGSAADFRSRIGAERDALISQLNANANPDVAASSASSAATALRNSGPQFSPLAAMLTPMIIGGSNYLEGRRAADLVKANAPTAPDPRAGGGTFTVG